MPAMEELAGGEHDFEWACCCDAKRQRWADFPLLILLGTHGENFQPPGRCTQRQQEKQTHKETFTQFDVLIVSEKQNDVGPDGARVAVPLEARPGAIARQVSGALGHWEDSHKDQQKEKRDRGGEPPPRHDGSL